MLRNKNVSKLLSLLITIIMLLGYFTSFVYAESDQLSLAKLDLHEEALMKIHPEVAHDLEKEDLVEVLIYMKDQVDTEKIAKTTRSLVDNAMTEYNLKLEVRRGVVEALRDKAELTQVNILNYLKQEMDRGNVLEYMPYNIVNMVYVKATKEVVKNISYMGEVEKIYKNNTHEVERPIVLDGENSLLGEELEWNIEKVMADRVWNLGIDGTGVVVGLLDSGVDWTHPALKEKWRGYNSVTGEAQPDGNWFDPVYNETLPADSDAHGTHVTGTMVGQESDGSNKIGVAPGAKWIAARVFNREGSTTDKILLDAAEWMLAPEGNPEKAPDVINNSWGGGAGINDWYRDAVRNWRAAGIFPVFSAGNQRAGEPLPWPGSISVPSNYPESFAVAATDRNNIRGSFSKLGPSPYDETLIKPDISAPGVSIRSSIPGGYQAGWSGTSMSAPHISGIAALLLSANSSLTVTDLEEIIIDTAIPLTDNTYPESPNFGYGYGIANAYEAIMIAIEGTGFIEGGVFKDGEDLKDANIIHEQNIFEVYLGSNIDITAEVSDDVAVTKVELLVKEGDKTYWSIIPMNMVSGDHRNGAYSALIPYNLLAGNKLIYKIIAKDYAGNVVTTKDYYINLIFGVLPDQYKEGFEDDNNTWSFDGSWEYGMPTGPSPEPYEGISLAGTNISGNYPDKADDWLITPPLDLRNKTLGSATLRFQEWYELENIFDKGYILITNDYGENWVDARPFITGDKKEWKEVVINLKDYLGSKNPVFIGFRLTSDPSNNKAGWYIDNARLVGIDNVAPETPVELTAEASPLGIVLNWEAIGDGDLSHYEIYRSLNQDNRFELLAESTSNRFTDTTVEVGNIYYYKVAAKDYSGNISGFSNMVWTEPLNLILIFGSDFEDNNGGFITGVTAGINNPWQWGIPTSGPNGATSGERLWATNLSGNYGNRTDAYIESPNIQLPSHIDSSLTFNHWVDMEGTSTLWDYGQVLISKDNGATWTNITPVTGGKYGKRVQTWTEEQISLTNYKGEKIKIRFFFHSDISGEYAGWYIDDVYILGSNNESDTMKLPIVESLQNMELQENVKEEQKENDNIDYHDPFFIKPVDKVNAFEIIKDIDLQKIPMTRKRGIPVEDAIITVLEVGRSVKTNPITGKFTLRNPVGQYTIRAEAYGYYSQEAIVNVEKDVTANHTFMLELKPKGKITGQVLDRYYGDGASYANIRIIEDGNIPPTVADENGNFTIEGVYEGIYTLKVMADGFETGEVVVEVVGNETVDIDIPLKRFIGFRDEIIYDDGTAEDSLVINGDGYGLAVRFTPQKFGKVTGTNMYFWDTSWPTPGGTEIGIAIYDINENGKAIRIGKPKIVNVNRGKWNYIDLSEYGFTTDRDFYISTIQTKIGDLSPGLGIDGPSKHANRSYTNIGGDFRPVIPQGLDAGFMIRAIFENIVDTPVVTNLDEITYTNQDKIVVEGKVTADGKVNIYLDGEKSFDVESEKEIFMAEVNLLNEETIITVTAELDGRETEPSMPIKVIKDQISPILQVMSPSNGDKIDKEVVHIQGNTFDQYFHKLLINGEEIDIDEDGNFHKRILVNEGENLITITSADKAGNETVIERKVYVELSGKTISNIMPSEDITLRPGDILNVSFEAPTNGEGYFKVLLPLGLESHTGGISMEEEDGIYSGTFVLPYNTKTNELIIEVVYISGYGVKTIEIAPGKIIVEYESMENLPANSVIIGDEVFDIEYLNTNISAQLKLIEYSNSGHMIYIKLNSTTIVDMNGNLTDFVNIPEILVYYDTNDNIAVYKK